MITHIKPKDFFQDLLRYSFQKKPNLLDDNLNNYLQDVLVKFVFTDNWKYSTLFEIYEKCIYESKMENFCDLGEHSLIISGVFPASMCKKTVGPKYYKDMGKIGYYNAGIMSRSLDNKALFMKMHDNFGTITNCLSLINQDTLLKNVLKS